LRSLKDELSPLGNTNLNKFNGNLSARLEILNSKKGEKVKKIYKIERKSQKNKKQNTGTKHSRLAYTY